jgi:hypothetical protein
MQDGTGRRFLLARSSGAQVHPGPTRSALKMRKKSYERYMALARAEALNGNTVAAENYYQHAEHYHRSMSSESEAT